VSGPGNTPKAAPGADGPVRRLLHMEREIEGLTDAAWEMRRGLDAALDHIEHLLKGPGTHHHSTDFEPGCTGCEGQRRWDEARAFLKEHGRKVRP